MSDVAVLSHTGRVRTVNEDAAGCLPIGSSVNGMMRMALAVCDGVGGRQAGATASSHVLVRLGELLGDAWWALDAHDAHWQPQVEERLQAIVRSLNEEIAQQAQVADHLRGMATTLACLLVLGNWYCALHVGDSRIYLLRGDRLQQLTADHNWAEEQRRLGRLTAEEIGASPYREQLMQVIGLGRPLEPSITFGRLAPGDRLLVCSDGLTKHVNAQQIGMVLRGEPTAERIASRLLEFALNGGGTDNISVAVTVIRSIHHGAMIEPESGTLRLDKEALDAATAVAGSRQPAHRRHGARRFLLPTALISIALLSAIAGLFGWRNHTKSTAALRPQTPKAAKSTGAVKSPASRPTRRPTVVTDTTEAPTINKSRQ